MNYKFQRKTFNEMVFVSLLKQLKYHYGNNQYRERIRKSNLKKCMYAAYNIPFYRKRFRDAGITPDDINDRKDLAKLPILTKNEFRQWMEEEGLNPINDLCMAALTSGSTGNPLKVLNTPYEYACDISTVLCAWMICGFNPFTKKTLTEYDNTSEDVGYRTFIQKLGILRRDVVDADGNVDDIINKINDYKPNLIRMYKSELTRIALYAQKNDIPIPKPDFYCVIGESLDPISERIISKTFGESMINLYGCVEAGTFAVKKTGGLVYDLLDDMTTVNIYDGQNRLTNDVGRIIFTTVYKNRFPLINYDIHDNAKVIEDERGLHFEELTGRDSDNVVYKDGDMTPWVVFWNLAAKHEEILQMRFVQESYSDLCIEIIPKDFTATESIEKAIRFELDPIIKNRLNVHFRFVDEIKSGGKGKIRMVVSNIH